jgi:hypothetical protein
MHHPSHTQPACKLLSCKPAYLVVVDACAQGSETRRNSTCVFESVQNTWKKNSSSIAPCRRRRVHAGLRRSRWTGLGRCPQGSPPHHGQSCPPVMSHVIQHDLKRKRQSSEGRRSEQATSSPCADVKIVNHVSCSSSGSSSSRLCELLAS